MQKKRILAAFLSAAMVITSAAVPVFAEWNEPLNFEEVIYDVGTETDEGQPAEISVFEEGGDVAKIGEQGYPTLEAAITAANAAEGETATIEILQDIDLEAGKPNESGSYAPIVSISKSVTIKSAEGADGPYTIKATTPHDYIFNITGGKTTLENIVIDGGYTGEDGSVDGGRAMIAVNITPSSDDSVVGEESAVEGGLILGNGAVLQNNNNVTATGAGGGLCVISGTAEIRDGAKIINNQANGGGGVAVINGLLKITGGEITENTAVDCSGSEGNEGRGGGVYLVGDQKDPYDERLIMTGGKISKNTSKTDGGGILAWAYTTIKMSDGEISENTCDNNGGAIYSYASRTELSGNASIKKNTASNDGGAVYMNGAFKVNPRSEFIMTGGEITGNEADGGSALFLNRYATLAMSAGEITQNNAKSVGGVLVSPLDNKVELSGRSKITGNTSEGGRRGDNLYMDGNPTGDGLFAELYAGKFNDDAQVDLYAHMWSRSEVLDNEQIPIVRPLDHETQLTDEQLKAFHSDDPSVDLRTDETGNFLATEPKGGNVIVDDTDNFLGTEVTLNGLSGQTNVVKDDERATYEVELSKAPDEDAAAVEKAISTDDDTNQEKIIFDIRVKKTTHDGTVSYVEGMLVNQHVSITLPCEPQDPENVKVYHVTEKEGNKEADEINNVTVTGKEIAFNAQSFSTYAIIYTPKDITVGNIADNIGVVYKQETDSKYGLYLKAINEAEADKIIHRYMSAELEFDLTTTEADNKISYDIEPSEYMAASRTEGDKWHFEMDGTGNPDASGSEIKLGTITFYGHGGFNFKVKTDATESINAAHTAKINNNIVNDYTETGETLLLNKDKLDGKLSNGELAEISGELTAPESDLTVNINFPNEVKGQSVAYTDMHVTISGLLLDKPITVDLGNNKGDIVPAVKYTNAVTDGERPAYAMYSFTQSLPEGRYTVTFSGEGYRTFSHDVLVDDEKTLTVWNNVMDESRVIITNGDEEKDSFDVTFLAGDIVDDKTINLYDLSAVVAYFGHDNTEGNGELTKEDKEYAQYDLNRDGQIDSKDIAMVLVSWGR